MTAQARPSTGMLDGMLTVIHRMKDPVKLATLAGAVAARLAHVAGPDQAAEALEHAAAVIRRDRIGA
jgi:hypothetical protein